MDRFIINKLLIILTDEKFGGRCTCAECSQSGCVALSRCRDIKISEAGPAIPGRPGLDAPLSHDFESPGLEEYTPETVSGHRSSAPPRFAARQLSYVCGLTKANNAGRWKTPNYRTCGENSLCIQKAQY
jgi:hypothetical protein